MLILRPVAIGDLDDLVALADRLDSMNLPSDREFLEARIRCSMRSFGGLLHPDETGVFVIDIVVLEGVHEQQRVVKPHAVRISFEGRLEVGLGLVDQAEPQLIDAEDSVGSPG